MVDYKTFRQMHPRASAFSFEARQRVPFDKWAEVIPHNANLHDNDYIILPPQIHGFAFKKKNWCTWKLSSMTNLY